MGHHPLSMDTSIWKVDSEWVDL